MSTEEDVKKYLLGIIPDIGYGEDPIGFLIASHAAIRHDNKELRDRVEQLESIVENNNQ